MPNIQEALKNILHTRSYLNLQSRKYSKTC